MQKSCFYLLTLTLISISFMVFKKHFENSAVNLLKIQLFQTSFEQLLPTFKKNLPYERWLVAVRASA